MGWPPSPGESGRRREGGEEEGEGAGRKGGAAGSCSEHTGREESVAGGAGEHSEPFIQHTAEKNPGSVLQLNGLTKQDKHRPVAVKGPCLQPLPACSTHLAPSTLAR